MLRERRGKGGWDEVLATDSHLVAPGGEWRSELWRIAYEQFGRAADALALDPELRARLLEPRRSLVVNFPLRRDDGSVETFTGYRVQQTLTLGRRTSRSTPGRSRRSWIGCDTGWYRDRPAGRVGRAARCRLADRRAGGRARASRRGCAAARDLSLKLLGRRFRRPRPGLSSRR